jgi:hypothetical protein
MNAKSIIAKLTESPIHLDYGADALPGNVTYQIKKLPAGQFELHLKFKDNFGNKSETVVSTVDQREEFMAFWSAIGFSSDEAEALDELKHARSSELRGVIDSTWLGDVLRNPLHKSIRNLIAKTGVYVPASRGLEKEHDGNAEYQDVVDFFARARMATIHLLARQYHMARLDTTMEDTDQLQSIISAQSALGIKVAMLLHSRADEDDGYLVFVPEAEFDKFVRRVTAAEFRA